MSGHLIVHGRTTNAARPVLPIWLVRSMRLRPFGEKSRRHGRAIFEPDRLFTSAMNSRIASGVLVPMWSVTLIAISVPTISKKSSSIGSTESALVAIPDCVFAMLGLDASCVIVLEPPVEACCGPGNAVFSPINSNFYPFSI
jgi:hypothetical protein